MMVEQALGLSASMAAWKGILTDDEDKRHGWRH